MKAQVKKHGVIFSVEAGDGKQATLIDQLAFWQSIPDQCGNCNHDKLNFFSKKPQDYHYVGVTCAKCGHEMNFGVRQSDNMLFLKEWEAPYQGGGGQQQSNQQSQGQNQQQSQQSQPSHGHGGAQDDDDIPF